MLSKILQSAIKSHALDDKTEECCGFVVSDKIYKCKNISNIKDHFLIGSTDYLKASTLGEISAVYHSHCNGNNDFSEFDKQISNNLNIKYILYCIQTDEFKEYVPQTYKNPYVGRDFKIGIADCFSLFRDYYKKELNIDVIDCERTHNWDKGNIDLFQDIYDKDNSNWVIKFGELNIGDLKKHDVIIFRWRKTGRNSHIAVYLGDGLILHQLENRFSTIEKYTEAYQRKTVYTARHKTLT